MDNGLVHNFSLNTRRGFRSLNPCCSGQWSSTAMVIGIVCCLVVLILVVVDNGLVRINLNKENLL